MPMDLLIQGAFELITNENKAGACLWISKHMGLVYWPTPLKQEKYLVGIDQKKFIGLNAVADAVEYLHSGKST
uniref:Uncharacterized protein n=1 Tax=Noccaea caerulescens TaxID=107243 RepID=A0A1J3CF16_NOCCA